MSAVLGPIHSWMYEKVMIQEQIIKAVITAAYDNNWTQAGSLDNYTRDSFPTLEEAIDLSNIHGSLSSMIGNVEERYAQLISELLSEDSSRLAYLEDIIYDFGKSVSIGVQTSAADVYDAINAMLLDGMPCDRCVNTSVNDDGSILVTRASDPHSGFWEYAKSSGNIYYKLRRDFAKGAIAESGFSIRNISDNSYIIE